MRTQTPIVCTECHRYMHGKSAYLSHSCVTDGVPSSFCIFLYLYSSLTVKTRIFNGKTRAARRLPPFLSVFLLPPPETGPDGHRRLPEPFPTQMVKWPQRRNGLPSHPSYPLSLSLSLSFSLQFAVARRTPSPTLRRMTPQRMKTVSVSPKVELLRGTIGSGPGVASLHTCPGIG